MKIIPKKIPQELVTIISPDGDEYILNELELLDLRIMICKANQSGWTGRWGTHEIEINENGDFIKWPHNLFSEDLLLLCELMGISLKKRQDGNI